MTNYPSALRPLLAALGVCLSLPAAAPALDLSKALQYLDSRQQQWANWKPAQRPGGACMSCHTGLPYVLAMRALNEKQPRPHERDLIQGVKTRLLTHPSPATLPDPGAEAVLNLFLLSRHRRGTDDPLEQADQAALARLWELQIQAGSLRGSWTWVNANLEPLDSEFSNYFGTALAELALSAFPAQPPKRVEALRGYLRRHAARQPLHNRLAWVAFRVQKDVKSQAAVLQDLWTAQAGDGGWSTAALGPWSSQPAAPPDSGSNAYATAWAAFAARQSGVSCAEPHLSRALDWLELRQDAATGAWNAASMNKVYPEGSMQSGFMTDAATGFAVAALTGCERRQPRGRTGGAVHGREIERYGFTGQDSSER